MAVKIKKGDNVIVTTGKSRGHIGEVLSINDGRVHVSGANMQKKHMKANPQRNIEGGIVEREGPLDLSNIALYNPRTKKADKVGFKTLKDGKKVRVFKSDGENVDV